MVAGLKFGSLFSGVGGFDLGFEQSGMVPGFMCEKDEAARAVLANHWPNVKIFEDVIDVTRTNVDLLCGGFPCQDLSVAGNRRGLDGDRSGLWSEFYRIIETNRPPWIVVENVPGLLSSNGGRDFGIILGALAQCGYGVAWRVLDSRYFGVPQRRRRVFIVGSLGKRTGAAKVLLEPEGMRGDSAAGEKSRGNDPDRPDKSPSSAWSFQSRFGRNGRGRPIDGTYSLMATNGSTGRGDFAPLVARALSTKWRAQHDVDTIGANSHAPAISFNVTQDPVPGDIAPPVPTNNGSNGVAVGPVVRRLTPMECERLQGFPDNWTAGQSDSNRYKQMGNAVTVTVARWIGRRIMEFS